MSITKREAIETTTMEAYLSGDNVRYEEELIKKFAWRCNGCGLVWTRKSQAEGCKARGHETFYVDRYPIIGIGQNGVKVVTGYNEYKREAIRRELPLKGVKGGIVESAL